MTMTANKNPVQYDNPEDAALMADDKENEGTGRVKTYFGQVTTWSTFTKTSGKGNPYTCMVLEIAALRPGIEPLVRDMNEFQPGWRKVTKPSLLAVRLLPSVLQDTYVQYQLTPSGEIYLTKAVTGEMGKDEKIALRQQLQNLWNTAGADRAVFNNLLVKKDMLEYAEGVKEDKAIEFKDFYPDRPTAEAAAEAFYDRSGAGAGTVDDSMSNTPAPAPSTRPTPTPASNAERKFVLETLPSLWAASLHNREKFLAAIAEPMFAKHVNATSLEVIALIGEDLPF